MKYKCISYKRIFPVAQYINETIGLEVELEDGDNPEEVFQQIKAQVNQWGAEKSMLPLLPEEPKDVVLVDRNKPLPVQKVEKPKGDAAILEQDIRRCKTLGELRTWKMLVDKNPVLKSAYDEVYNQLTQSVTQ